MRTNLRRVGAAIPLLSLLTLSFSTVPVFAATQDAKIIFKPHCLNVDAGSGEQDWLFGPIPSPGIVVEATPGLDAPMRCPTFNIQDPQTLVTSPLRVGDILDIDVVVENPTAQSIARVRTWISYDPNVLDGQLLSIDPKFSQVTPGEQDFYPEEGYAKIDASTTENLNTPDVIVARIQFVVKKTVAVGSPIGFHDAQPEGHTLVTVKEGTEQSYILGEEPGVLLVMFQQEENSGVAPIEGVNTGTTVLSDDTVAVSDNFNPLAQDTEDSDLDEVDPEEDEERSSSSSTTTKTPVGGSCIQNQECETGLCIAGICKQAGTVATGGACTVDEECASGLCGNNVCVASLGGTSSAGGAEPQRTAFGLLQIQNLRITTEGTSVFLAWDHLRSSALQGYNIYYGTTSGKYIQRKSIGKEENSVTIRSLPTGTQYFFAVRGVSTQSEESAFSKEVSVIVGNPASASMPLTREPGEFTPPSNPLDGNLTGENPVPGETGVSSVMVMVLLSSAVAGTLLASRRQMIVSPVLPNA